MSEKTKKVAIAEEKNMCTKKEVFGHAMGALGHDAIYSMWSSWITPFFTDVLLMTPGFMGVLFTIARIWDGVNDVMWGTIVDRTKSKYGRFRPWLLRSSIVVAICLILSFTVPGFGSTGNMIFAAIFYILFDMAFTTIDISYWGLPAAMSSNPGERNKIFAYSTTASNAISTIMGIGIPMLLVAFGGETSPKAFFAVAAIVGVFGCVMYLVSFALTREHVTPANSEAFSLKLALKNIYVNKPLFCIMIANLVTNLAFIIKMSVNYYYCVYNLGNVELMSIISLVTVPCMIIGSLLVPVISKRTGKKKALIGIMGVNLVASAVFYLVGYSNVVTVIICNAIQITCVGAAMVLINSMNADTIEYGEWITGQRNEGVITSTRTLVVKIASTIQGITLAAVLGMTGYVPGAEQAASTLGAFHFVVSMLTGIVMFAGVIPMFFYDLTEEKHAQITAELAARKTQK